MSFFRQRRSLIGLGLLNTGLLIATWWLLFNLLGLELSALFRSWQQQAPTWTAGQKTTAFLLLSLGLSLPRMLWQLLLEWQTSYQFEADGLTIRTIGLLQFYPWQAVEQLRPAYSYDDYVQRIDVLMTDAFGKAPWYRRWFYRHYCNKVPLYATSGQLTSLLSQIKQHWPNNAV
ncbi:hypothetical protein [Herpetosiphon geysericola]|uniref:Uncharacterized protein n=1 Tax=Herpetosiphon geysericola TaxID=70996 RepID=A0A0P6Z2D7_9CHLR|nr:hypothetical protein [Herpetosiphon geysericola]KPL91357.1 hypothetical protein SE18_02755 [Herpetosiphon geysericola]